MESALFPRNNIRTNRARYRTPRQSGYQEPAPVRVVGCHVRRDRGPERSILFVEGKGNMVGSFIHHGHLNANFYSTVHGGRVLEDLPDTVFRPA